MVDFPSLNQLPNETAKAYSAFLDYVHMGPERSLPHLHDSYLQQAKAGQKPPTRFLSTLKDWSSTYKWQDRLGGYLQELAQGQAVKQRERLETFNEDIWQTYLQLRAHVIHMVAEFTPQRVTRRRRLPHPENPDHEMEIVTMRVNTRELEQLVRAFGQLGKDLRLQLGLPTSIDLTSGGQALKAYVSVSPDDWDEAPNGVPPAPVADSSLAG